MQFNVPKNVYPLVDGQITSFTFQDPDEEANQVLDIDRNWTLTVEWHLTGTGAHAVAMGTWFGQITIESLGGQEEKTLIEFSKPGTAIEPGSSMAHMHYKQEITVLARDLATALPDRVNQPGAYMLTTLITHKTEAFPAVADPVAGFLEGPILQFYSLI